ncbi:uncharacterized protein [Temnothorax longispinosus]|uniref:uncharacterized protein n=1 Tax=Temnothorax longispinosus TaxID=300112 RepID=UPI003A98FFFF
MGQIGEQGSNNGVSDLQSKHDSNIQNKKQKEEKKYKCDYPDCNAVFLRPNRLERHIRSHTGEKPYKCSHPECTKSYTNSSHLKRHLETHNAVKKVYTCTECSMGMRSLQGYKRHYKQTHSEKRISCKECNATFNKKHQLVTHQASEHSIMPIVYKCDRCNRSYLNRSRFNRHQKTHEKRCPVPGCSEVFDKWTLLCEHRRTNHKDHKCDTCGKVFRSKARLILHCKIHSEDRLVFPCPYDTCHRFYFYKSNLDEHVRTSHLGKKFYCDICSVGYTSKRWLIAHIKRHYEPKKKKKKNREPRKKRKDVGVPKRSVMSALIGVDLPYSLEKMIRERETMINETVTTTEAS